MSRSELSLDLKVMYKLRALQKAGALGPERGVDKKKEALKKKTEPKPCNPSITED